MRVPHGKEEREGIPRACVSPEPTVILHIFSGNMSWGVEGTHSPSGQAWRGLWAELLVAPPPNSLRLARSGESEWGAATLGSYQTLLHGQRLQGRGCP